MAKKQSKVQIIRKWNEKISRSKEIFKAAYKEQGKKPPKFEDSEMYENINKRKLKALKRFKNRDKINAENRKKYKLRKEANEGKDDFSHTSEVSVFEAYSGRGRKFENSIRDLVKERKSDFYGEIYVRHSLQASDTIIGTYVDVSKYSMKINQMLRKFYETKNSDGKYIAFSWRVLRSYFFDVEKNTLYVSHIFIEPKK